ncbi:MAG: cysteine--tRNA ligase, partial [Muribaculaceae bacterium]|nr:cysteine--tRNA ligase [Muribaculaceae bacterium]
RFFLLQAHYRSTVDFSNEALQASEKAYARMMEGWKRLADLKPADESDMAGEIGRIRQACYDAMNDDFNTPVVIAHLFEALSLINKARDGHMKVTQADIDALKALFDTFLFEILGMLPADGAEAGEGALEPYRQAVNLLLEVRAQAKAAKDWATSDLIRDRLAAIGFSVKDTRDGSFEWSLGK